MAETKNEPTTEEKPSEPTEPTEPKSLSQEDINKLINSAKEEARKQEKDKLYGTIEDLKGKLEQLTESQKQDKADKDKVAADAAIEADKERQAKLSAEDRMAEQLQKFEERLAKEADERMRLEQKLEAERQKAELERYKHELLSSAGNELVKEMVTGNTKEEIAASVDVAKQRYQEYFQAAVTNAEGTPGRTVQQAGATMPSPANPDPDPLDEEGLRGLIPNVDPYASGAGQVNEEYKKNRDAILARVDSAYRKSTTR